MSDSFTVKIFLYDIEPAIWRRINVPGEITMAKFHTIIQQAMGWEDRQAHEFLHGKGKKLDQIIAAADHDHAGAPYHQDETKIKLADFVGRKRLPLRLLYRYDFAEDWIHEIVVEAKEPTDSNKPTLIDGERACPPEDSGGPWEYKSCLAGESDWLDPRYDPEVFDPNKVKLK